MPEGFRVIQVDTGYRYMYMYSFMYCSFVCFQLTEFYGYAFFGLYHVVVLIVLVNMLIAMMARSYEVIAVSYESCNPLVFSEITKSFREVNSQNFPGERGQGVEVRAY